MKLIIDEITAYIRKNLQSIQSVQELADYWGYSSYHFSREFKRLTGFTIAQLIAALKMEMGIEKLVKENSSILGSQLHAGYLSSGTFTVSFEKQTGMTPKNYQKKLQTLYQILMAYENEPESQVFSHYEPVKSEEQASHCCVNLNYPANSRSGITFVGLFRSPIPNHKPIVGKALIGNTVCILDKIPPGDYYLLACSVEKNSSLKDYFILKDCLRGRIEGTVKFPTHHRKIFSLLMRPPIEQDPPILVNLPQLLADSIKGRNLQEK